jgi:hypothetical protein
MNGQEGYQKQTGQGHYQLFRYWGKQNFTHVYQVFRVILLVRGRKIFKVNCIISKLQ